MTTTMMKMAIDDWLERHCHSSCFNTDGGSDDDDDAQLDRHAYQFVTTV